MFGLYQNKSFVKKIALKWDVEQQKQLGLLVEIALDLLNFHGWLDYHLTKHGFVEVH